MATALLRMINSQADALERIAGLDVSGPADVLAQARRIVLVGTGTSLHAAELGAMMLARAGRDAYAYPAAAWARWGNGPRAGDAVCVITHTAETAYAARARAGALAAGVPLVSVTGSGRGWPEAIETVAPDESHTYSVSYTATLAVLARIAYALGAPDGAPDQLALATAQVREVCAAPDPAPVAVPARSLAIVGCGPWAVTAREGALKIREAARMLAEGFDTDRLLHGGAVADAARVEGMAVTVLAAPPGLAPLLAQIPMTVRLQLLAETFAMLRHQNPDVAITGAWDDPALWAMGAPVSS